VCLFCGLLLFHLFFLNQEKKKERKIKQKPNSIYKFVTQ